MTTRALVPNNPTVSVDYFHLLILRHYNSKLVKMNVSNLLHLAELTYYQSV